MTAPPPATWRPMQVCFSHPAPRDRATYLKLFGPHVEFDQDFDGILTYSSDLDAEKGQPAEQQ